MGNNYERYKKLPIIIGFQNETINKTIRIILISFGKNEFKNFFSYQIHLDIKIVIKLSNDIIIILS